MTADPSKIIDHLRQMARQAGACAWGIAKAEPVTDDAMGKIARWIADGRHASMDYLRRHLPLKRSLDSVLPGCQSLLSFAFPYFSELSPGPGAVKIARHALGEDYHDVLRRQLTPIAKFISREFDAKTRICVDSAPVAERYWALRCGLGSIGRNGLLYVPGYGSWVLLAEILTTARFPERLAGVSSPTLEQCGECTRCLDACPGKAIGDGAVDCRRCRAYLTIECRDEQLPSGVSLGQRVYGCDICQEVCPANAGAHISSDLFAPRPQLLSLTTDDINNLDVEGFEALTRGSSMRRITLVQLKRNAGRKDGIQPFDPQDC